ncbi:MAG: hypothetical protein WAR83_03580, partial [Flavobacteriales bacterium]
MITKRISTWAFALTLASVGYGQIEWHANPGGNTIVGGEWFGADVNSTIPLQIRHDANQPIEWYTDAIQRMGLNPTQNSTINGFTVPTDGFLGLGLLPVPGTAPGTPWSRLHLHDATSGAGFVALGFRDWMRNGVTFTGHGDQMFVGHKYGPGPTDGTDAIFQWADNSSELLGPDLM